MTTAEMLDALVRAGYRGMVSAQLSDTTAVEYEIVREGWVVRSLYTHYADPTMTDEMQRTHWTHCHKSRRQKYMSKHARKPYV